MIMNDAEEAAQDAVYAQAMDALHALIDQHSLPAPHRVDLYGGYPGARSTWLDVRLASVVDAHTWAIALGTEPTPDAWFTGDGRLVCLVHVARHMSLTGCPVPVDVDYWPDQDALQARPPLATPTKREGETP